MIVDAQIHAWKETAEYPTPETVRRYHGSDYAIERALAVMDANGVDRAILVPPASWPTGVTRNSYSLDAARRHPSRFGVMGLFDYDAPDARDRLAGWRRPGMLGIRTWLGGGATVPHLVGDAFDWFWSALEAHQIPFMSAAPGRMHLFADILRRFPLMRLIIDHAAREPRGATGEAAWADLGDTLALAKWPRTAIKVSCLPTVSGQAYPFCDLHPFIRRIYDAFGPRRMLWGSDATRLNCSYTDNLRLFTEALGFLSDEDRGWILGKATLDACGWQSDEA